MQTLSIDKLSLLEGRSPSFISRDHTYPRRHPPSSRVCRPPSSVGGKIGRVSPAHRIICLHPRLPLQLPSWVDDTVGRSSYCRYSGVQHLSSRSSGTLDRGLCGAREGQSRGGLSAACLLALPFAVGRRGLVLAHASERETVT